MKTARRCERAQGGDAEALLRERFGLTPSESTVALLVADGLTYAEIAEKLEISTHTVHAHVKAVHEKRDVRSNGRAAALIRGLERPA